MTNIAIFLTAYKHQNEIDSPLPFMTSNGINIYGIKHPIETKK